jgi:hypothetical protein
MRMTEHTPDGIEVRCAVGTDKTIDAQREYFERTKEPNNIVTISDLLPVLNARGYQLCPRFWYDEYGG